jgi:hypothetical protein
MRAILRAYHQLNILSVDVVAGSIVSALFFAGIFGVDVKTYGLIALGLTVWVIYTTDHLLDAKKIKHAASTQRHRFHQQYFRILIFFLCLAVLVDCIMIFFIRRQVFEWGVVLAGIVILYLLAQRSLRFLKEFFIAALYTSGVLLLSVAVTPMVITAEQYFLIAQFGMIAWINLLLFSWFDHVFDERDEQNSFVTIMGKEAAFFFLYALYILNFALSLIQIVLFGFSIPMLLLFAMNVTLFLIFIFRNRLAKDDLYRLIGDAVFLFPTFFLLWHP